LATITRERFDAFVERTVNNAPFPESVCHQPIRENPHIPGNWILHSATGPRQSSLPPQSDERAANPLLQKSDSSYNGEDYPSSHYERS
jgi:hypothetical protein